MTAHRNDQPLNQSLPESSYRQSMVLWGQTFQKRFCKTFELLERAYQSPQALPGRFVFKEWKQNNGCESIGVLRGPLFEKAGITIATLNKTYSQSPFWTNYLLISAHPFNPYVPAIYFSVRMVETTKVWLTGAIDLIPTIDFTEDTMDFNRVLEDTCSNFNDTWYQDFKKNYEQSFFIKHRNEQRGASGIFFDQFNSGCQESDMNFFSALSESLLLVYPQIVRRRMYCHWTPEDKYQQLMKRGKCSEFTLMYDQHVKFCLDMPCHFESILLSLPPAAGWE